MKNNLTTKTPKELYDIAKNMIDTAIENRKENTENPDKVRYSDFTEDERKDLFDVLSKITNLDEGEYRKYAYLQALNLLEGMIVNMSSKYSKMFDVDSRMNEDILQQIREEAIRELKNYNKDLGAPSNYFFLRIRHGASMAANDGKNNHVKEIRKIKEAEAYFEERHINPTPSDYMAVTGFRYDKVMQLINNVMPAMQEHATLDAVYTEVEPSADTYVRSVESQAISNCNENVMMDVIRTTFKNDENFIKMYEAIAEGCTKNSELAHILGLDISDIERMKTIGSETLKYRKEILDLRPEYKGYALPNVEINKSNLEEYMDDLIDVLDEDGMEEM